MAVTNQPIRFGRFKGVNNKQDMLGLEHLTLGKNIDIDKNGKVRRRGGFKSVTVSASSSLWSNGDICLFAEAGLLKRLADDFVTTSVITPIQGDVCYYSALGKIYFSDGVSSWVLQDGVARSWGIKPPPAPTVETSFGSMPFGMYMIAITYVATDGRESGSSSYAVARGEGSVSVTNIVQPASGFVRVYASTLNGNVLYRVAELKNGETSAVYNGEISNVQLKHNLASAAPGGHIICYYKGRMYIADGNVIWSSEPYHPEMFNKSSQYMQFDGRITLMFPVLDGIYVGDGSIKFLQGDSINDFKVNILAEYNAIEGTADYLDAKYFDGKGEGVVFTSERGICVGGAGGSFSNLTEDDVAFQHGFKGVGHVRRINGMVQYLSLINGDAGNAVNNYSPVVGQIEMR